MKRVKVVELGVHQILLLAGLVIISVDSQASAEFTTHETRFTQQMYQSPVSRGDLLINRFSPAATNSLNSTTASSSVNGQLNYSNGTGSGSFSESDSNPAGAKVEVELQRKGYGYLAEASAKTGFARSFVETNWVPANGSTSGNSSAQATSNWSDWFVISGGTGVGTASFTSLLDGVLASSKNGSASLSVNIGYTPKTSCFTLCGEADMNQTLLNQISNLSGKSKSTMEQALEGQFTFAYNKPFALTVMLGVQATNGGMADFTLGSLGNSLLLPQGAGLYSASGLDYVQAVPEAETYAMMLAGLGLVGWAARRRRATPK